MTVVTPQWKSTRQPWVEEIKENSQKHSVEQAFNWVNTCHDLISHTYFEEIMAGMPSAKLTPSYDAELEISHQ